MTTRRTVQLAAVYEAVRSAHDHPTVDEIHRRVRRRVPRVSLGTVYRNLQKLVQHRHVRPLHLSGRAVRYDAAVDDHDHCVCETCGAVTDLPQPQRGEMPHPLAGTGFVVRGCTMTFYGVCATCNEKMSVGLGEGSPS